MRYVLEDIEQQVHSVLSAVGSVKFKEPEISKMIDGLEQECSKVIAEFKHQILSGEEEQCIIRSFHFHQRGLTRLLNRIPAGSRQKTKIVLGKLVRVITGLLLELETEFPEYFDQKCSLPHCLQEQVKSEIAEAIQSITEKYETTTIDRRILTIVTAAFESVNGNPETLSYSRLYFLRALKQSLMACDVRLDSADLLRQDVCRMLIQLNYNSELFFQYYVEQIHHALTLCETLSDKIDQLSYYFKVCCQEHTAHVSFDFKTQSINIQFVEWISQELEYYRNKQQLQLSQPSKVDGLAADFKLNFDLSVSHLAYLFKSFIETGIVQNKNTSELIRFLTKFVKTKKSESVSYESFRIKFYNPETGTKDAVKKTLQSLLNYMNKN